MPRRTSDHVDVASVDAALADSLESLDHATHYRDWIVSLARPYLGERLLEIGAGRGTFSEAFAESAHVHAVEPSPTSGDVLSARYRDHDRVTTQLGTVEDVLGDRFDTAVMINVLEHIDDESGVLSEIRDRLVPRGHLVLWVPAFPVLYSRFDRTLGHHRRYRRDELERIVTDHGYQVIDSRYVNLPGWFSWLVLVRLLRSTPTNPTMIRAFDRLVVPPVRWIETRWRAPFGQSVFLVARVDA